MAKSPKPKPTFAEWALRMEGRRQRWEWRARVAEARASARKWREKPDKPRGRSRPGAREP